jgi:hypothetical protein
VYKGVWRGREVAVKVFDPENSNRSRYLLLIIKVSGLK